ncbi:hypothetical protein [Azospirillum brasilense]|uniref:hypothetical protein n=1 Tax=Azospirillum brasilense TaxID=192 RepID=UPI0013B40389|nr:hypothetical protein [Azospirillum brasilense]
MQPEAGNSETEASSTPPLVDETAFPIIGLKIPISFTPVRIVEVTPEMVRNFKPVVSDKRHPFGLGLPPPLKP